MKLSFKERITLFFNQLSKYIVVGMLSYVIDYVIFVILSFRFHYQTATFIGLIIGLTFNYIWSGKYVFKDIKISKVKEILFYGITTVGAIFLTSLGMHIFVECFLVSEYISKLIVSFIVFIFNFLIRKYVIFR